MVLAERGNRWFVVLGLAATAGLATLIGQKPGVDDSMGSLVAEIRELRYTVERSMSANSQAQLLLGRVLLQENRLATLGHQLQEARTRLADQQASQAAMERQLRHMTAMLDDVHSTEERQAIQARIADLKDQVKQQQARSERLRGDETAAAAALSTEQNRWSEFNERLEALERTLAAQLGSQR
jgi:chromosome segregation ATPase